MAEVTSRHALPLLQPGQAQKEMWHNEAVALADALLHPLAEGETATPPAEPEPGRCWLVGAGAGGAWAGRSGALACWTRGGWRFCAPVEGMAVWRRDIGCEARFHAGGWVAGRIDGAMLAIDGVAVVRAQQPAIAAPAGGTTVDSEGRAAINAILNTLRTHGLIGS